MKTDKHIGGGIYLAQSVLAGRKRNKALDVATVVNRTIDAFKHYLNVPSNLVVRITSFKGGMLGVYRSRTSTVELSYNLPWRKAMEILAHEMVHAEQFHEKRLEVDLVKGKWYYFWNGVKSNNRGTTFAAYRNQPWEQEAYDRQEMLTDWVCQDMEEWYEQESNSQGREKPEV